MSIADEITALNTNLAAAKAAVTAAGGTVGDTGLAGLAAEIATIPVGGGGDEPGGEARITGYNTTTGVISGSAFGATAGTVYMLDRDTHTYIAQPTSSWSSTSITLTTPIDLSTLEGDTSIVVVTNDGEWSTKWLVTGQIAVTGFAKAYVKDPDTGVVRTVAVTSAQWSSQFKTSSNAYAKKITIGSDVFYSDEVVGVQFGSSFDLSVFDSYTLAYFVNLNQPLTIPSSVTIISQFFMAFNFSFNQPLTIPSGCTSIGKYFLASCYSFNQPITIPSTVTTLWENFLTNCYSFNQPITIPSGISAINNSFLSSCYRFNQPLTIPSNITSIAANFLANCYSFNQPLTIPNTVTSISGGFMNQCYIFNKPITLSSSLTSIPNTFMNTCYSFNQPLTIPSGVTTIGMSFLKSCYAFNQPLTIPSGVTTINSEFLATCNSFNQPLTIPSTVTSVGSNFLQSCFAFSSLTTNTTASPTDNNSLSTTNAVNKVYVKGVTVTGTGTSTWLTNLPNRTSSPYRKLIDGTA